MLLELQFSSVKQRELALEDDDLVDRENLMATLNRFNLRYDMGTVQMASADVAGDRRTWLLNKSAAPRLTTLTGMIWR